MNWKKNDLVTVDVTDLGQNGEGVGHIDSFAIFIRDAVPGDRCEARLIKVKKTYAVGKLLRILAASDKRCERACGIADRCGGCQLQAMRYEAQLAWKAEKVRNDLQRIGHIANPPMKPIAGMKDPWRYRNKSQYPVRMGDGGAVEIGYYASHSHRIVPVEDCLIGSAEDRRILNRIRTWMTGYGISAYDEETGVGAVRHILIRKGFKTGEILVCLVTNESRLPHGDELCGELMQIPGLVGVVENLNRTRGNVILGRETRLLWGREFIRDSIGEISYRVSAVSFYQVNPIQTEKLYAKVLEYAAPAPGQTLMDLYCGTGTITLFLAAAAGRVIGVEIVERAIEDARKNAEENGIANAEFYAGKAEEIVPDLYEKKGLRADVVVVDPPRKGCDEKLLSTIIDMEPERLVYVSCNPATLARDLEYLGRHGYQIVEVTPFDLFPHTVHVETVCLLGRRKPDDTIKVSVNMDDYYQIRDAEEAEKNLS